MSAQTLNSSIRVFKSIEYGRYGDRARGCKCDAECGLEAADTEADARRNERDTKSRFQPRQAGVRVTYVYTAMKTANV
jgi:hypothetical protein